MPTGQALTDPKLESALREAGHAVRAVTSPADLESALRSGTFDVVLANVTHAPELERAKAVAERNAVVLPAIYLVAPGTQPVSQAAIESRPRQGIEGLRRHRRSARAAGALLPCRRPGDGAEAEARESSRAPSLTPRVMLLPCRTEPRMGHRLSALLGGFASPAAAQAVYSRAGPGHRQSVLPVRSDERATRRFRRVVLERSCSSMNSVGPDRHSCPLWYVEYGLTKRIAVHASLPYIQGRYEGLIPHDIGFDGQPSNLDDGSYHGTFQDFYFGTRFKLLESPRFALTPFVEVIIPSHQYESLAQTAAGRDLRALVVGAAVGGFADDLLPGLYFQTRISHAFVQQAVDVRPNRTGIDSSVGYFVTPRLAIQFIQTFQFTHDGIDFVGPPIFIVPQSGAPMTEEYQRNHDRLTRANSLKFGAGVAFAFTEKLGVFATFTKLAWGQNLPPPQSITVGMNWGFQTRGPAVRP